MNLNGTKTLINLARSFAGESQAANRYRFYASRIKKDGHEVLYRIISEIENNERAHAKVFFKYIADNENSGYDNIDIDGGYPYKLGDTPTNLASAASGEEDEATIIYPKFAKIAREEGFLEIAATYDLIASVESEHKKMFESMLKYITDGTLYKRAEPVRWKCENCGYEYTSKHALEVCPLCKHGIGYMRASF